MLQRDLSTTMRAHMCPACGVQLLDDGDLLICRNHGAFFAYGPHLLVRAPMVKAHQVRSQLPWEPAARSSAHS